VRLSFCTTERYNTPANLSTKLHKIFRNFPNPLSLNELRQMNLHQQAEERRRAIQSRNNRRTALGMQPCPGCPQTAAGPRTWLKPQPTTPTIPDRSSNDSDQNKPFDEAQDVPSSDPVVTEYLSRVIGKQIVPQPVATPVPQPLNPVKLHRRHGHRPRWAVGVTCVPERFNDLLPQTLASLRAGGFEPDRLFVDGMKGFDAWKTEERFGVPVTNREPRIGIFGNWALGLAELMLRNPGAERFVMCQDDILLPQGLRQYLESECIPDRCYLNGYTFEPGHPGRNSQLPPPDPDKVGWYKSNQLGRGALFLVFDRDTSRRLLTSQNTVRKSEDGTLRGKRNIDGCIITSMKDMGYTELVHNPSLVGHSGHGRSILGNANPQAMGFPGTAFDAREWIKR
jgi:hypothetical protein